MDSPNDGERLPKGFTFERNNDGRQRRTADNMLLYRRWLSCQLVNRIGERSTLVLTLLASFGLPMPVFELGCSGEHVATKQVSKHYEVHTAVQP